MTGWLPPNARSEERSVLGDFAQPRDDFFDRVGLAVRIATHFFERLDRLERLRLEAGDAEVPEHRGGGRHVVPDWSMPLKATLRIVWLLRLTNGIAVGGREPPPPAEPDAVDADGEVEGFGVPEVGVMAGRARDILPPRGSGSQKQQPSQLDFR